MEYFTAKTVLALPPDVETYGIDYVANLYRGCNLGCVYCDGHSDCYKMKNFNVVSAKKDALAILENELAHKRKKGIVALGTLSDCYNPHEKETELTRGALQLLDKYGFGVSVETKSDLVVRDIDVLCSIAKHSPAVVKFSVCTPYDDLSRKLEPKANPPRRRFAALRKLSDAGLFTGICLTPVLPFITDDSASILSLIESAAQVGCKFAYAGEAFGVTLRDSQRAYFLNKIEKAFPGMKEKYEKAYPDAYLCVSPNNDSLLRAFADKCDSLGLLHTAREISQSFLRPYQTCQISLFDF